MVLVKLIMGGAHMGCGFLCHPHTLQNLDVASQMMENKFFRRTKTTLSLPWLSKKSDQSSHH